MDMLFLFLFIINGLMAPTTHGAIIDFKTKKPIICAFKGNKVGSKNLNTPIMDPKTMPPECDIIFFNNCDFTDASNVQCPDYFKTVVDLKRPLILGVIRSYESWAGLLKPDGNDADAKGVIDFAKANGAIGVMIVGISYFEKELKPDVNVANNAVKYFKQLKSNPDFVVGIYLNSEKPILTDPNVFNYEASNEFVDFYMANTYLVNKECDVTTFNGLTPNTDTNGLIGLDTIIGWAKTTKMCMDKVYLVVDLVAYNPDDSTGGFSAYSEVCSGIPDTSHWCIPSTKDLFDKAKYIFEQKYGIVVYWIEFDDINNACKCDAFIGLKNIVAGYKSGKPIPCDKIDIRLASI